MGRGMNISPKIGVNGSTPKKREEKKGQKRKGREEKKGKKRKGRKERKERKEKGKKRNERNERKEEKKKRKEKKDIKEKKKRKKALVMPHITTIVPSSPPVFIPIRAPRIFVLCTPIPVDPQVL